MSEAERFDASLRKIIHEAIVHHRVARFRKEEELQWFIHWRLKQELESNGAEVEREAKTKSCFRGKTKRTVGRIDIVVYGPRRAHAIAGIELERPRGRGLSAYFVPHVKNDSRKLQDGVRRDQKQKGCEAPGLELPGKFILCFIDTAEKQCRPLQYYVDELQRLHGDTLSGIRFALIYLTEEPSFLSIPKGWLEINR